MQKFVMQDFAETIITKLAQAQVEFVVVGGISAVLQGAPIVTRDLDICYSRSSDNLRRLAAALEPFKPQLRDLPAGVPNIFDLRSLEMGANFTLEVEGQALDLLAIMSEIGGYDDILDNADEMEVAGHQVRVLALADLIRTKRAAGRPKDLAVIPTLEATLEMQQRQE
ncbi:MAG TPA: hypothetical protein VMM76_21125 [Pirellulaceae bacterium]|nr:hypothetical protein [Pirellulaceae bacterium]